jgi:osmoprotectant transport system permease protein
MTDRRLSATFHFHKVSDWEWITGHMGYFWSVSRTHLYLAMTAVAIGLVLALPLGVACVRLRKLYGPVLAITSVLYSLPSLAVFAFLVSVTGLTNLTVIIPLAVYALALLVRSVVDGLENVSAEVRLAATAMGYRPLRRLLSVELPAAVPVVMAGLRVATVSSISLVTVGALIGIGGLGQLFTAGENNNFQTEILVGIVLVLIWALVFDVVLLIAERLLAPWATKAVRS